MIAEQRRPHRRRGTAAARRVDRYTGRLLIGLTVALSALFVTFAVAREYGWSAWTMLSGSMADVAPTGSLVVGKTVDAGDIQPGDVIVVKPDPAGMEVMHRVISVGEVDDRIKVVTKGDANPNADQPVMLEPEVTKAEYAVPHLGAWLTELKDFRTWRYILAGMVAVAVAYLFWPQITGRRRRWAGRVRVHAAHEPARG